MHKVHYDIYTPIILKNTGLQCPIILKKLKSFINFSFLSTLIYFFFADRSLLTLDCSYKALCQSVVL